MTKLSFFSLLTLNLIFTSCITETSGSTSSQIQSSSSDQVILSTTDDVTVSNSKNISSNLQVSTQQVSSNTNISYAQSSQKEQSSSIAISSSSVTMWDTTNFTDTLSLKFKDSLRTSFLNLVTEAMDSNKTFENDNSWGLHAPYNGADDSFLDSLWNEFPGMLSLCLKGQQYIKVELKKENEYQTDTLRLLNSEKIEYQEINSYSLRTFPNRMMEEVKEASCETDEYILKQFNSDHYLNNDSIYIEKKGGKSLSMVTRSNLN